MFSKLDCKKSYDWNIEIAVPQPSSLNVACENDLNNQYVGVLDSRENENQRNLQAETKRVLFKDVEDLNLIRKQLVQIENQQSSLLDLLQRFIGNSQSRINSLETHVNGLEKALDEISYDLAVSTGRFSNTDSVGNTSYLVQNF